MRLMSPKCDGHRRAATFDGYAPTGVPTNHQELISWVNEIAELTQPDNVVWCDGSESEYERLCEELVAKGTFKRLDPIKLLVFQSVIGSACFLLASLAFESGTPTRYTVALATSLFYQGINLGAFLGPIITGFLVQDERFRAMLTGWGMNPNSAWHWGFGAAGVGMTLGLVQYVYGWRYLGTAGLHPPTARTPELYAQAKSQAIRWIGIGAAILILLAIIIAFAPSTWLRQFRDMDRWDGLYILNYIFGTICYVSSLGQTSIAHNAVIFATLPFIAALLAWMFMRELPSREAVFASIIAMIGVVIMVGFSNDGALLGDVLGDPRAYGLDAAAAAAFLALLWPRLRRRQPIVVGVAAAVIATVLTPVLMPGLPVIIAATVAIVVGWFNWLGSEDPIGSAEDEPRDVAEREGLP